MNVEQNRLPTETTPKGDPKHKPKESLITLWMSPKIEHSTLHHETLKKDSLKPLWKTINEVEP